MGTQSSTEAFGHTVQDELVSGFFTPEPEPEPTPEPEPAPEPAPDKDAPG